MSHPQKPRLLPATPFPEYSYVPGLWPHPHRLRRADATQPAAARPELPSPDQWQSCEGYLRGIDLWNHGYYWEAHEEWETLWHAAGRQGPIADFFKGLIQLAVAGVKVRQGIAEGVRSHAHRAAELLESVLQHVAQLRFFGLSLERLIEIASEVEAMDVETTTPEKVRVVFDATLEPV